MTVSLVVPTYRGAERLSRLLASLPGAGALRDMELLVGDDGSPPDDARAIAQAVESFDFFHDRRVLRNESNAGPVATLARLIFRTHGHTVLQLDDDVTLPGEFFHTMLRLLNLPGMGVLSWRSQGMGPGQSVHPVPGYLEPATELAGYCMAYKRERYEEVQGVDERYRYYCSDSDFALRVCLAGRPCYRVHWPLVPHEEHGAVKASPEIAARRQEWVDRDLGAFRRKWGGTGPEMQAKALAALGKRA